jgi:dethiobiotin synthetase
MSAIFVTGTGTGVGKTYVVRDLIGYERACGRSVEAVKPIVTGFDPDALEGSDPALILEALGRPVGLGLIETVSPRKWRYRTPVSPDMAAAREGRPIDFDNLIMTCRLYAEFADGNHKLLIEGIGGAMTPLDQTHTVRDWIAALEIPAILVAGSYLGAISHTLTTLEALNAKRISVREIVISESAQSPVPPSETAGTLARFTAVPIRILRRDILGR